MRIGIDIDDTITNTKEYIMKLKLKEFPNRNPLDPLPEDILKDFLVKYDDDIHQSVTLKPNVVENLERLKSHGHEIYFITSRGYTDNAEKNTLEFFRKYNIPYDELLLYCDEKGKIAKLENIDLFIDDKTSMLEQMREENIPAIKIHTYEEQDKFMEYDNWNDLVDYILSL